jgi:hypothetical protein
MGKPVMMGTSIKLVMNDNVREESGCPA